MRLNAPDKFSTNVDGSVFNRSLVIKVISCLQIPVFAKDFLINIMMNE